MSKEKSKFKDIFSGEYLTIWEDEDLIFISFPYCTINIPKDEWDYFKKDIEKLGEL